MFKLLCKCIVKQAIMSSLISAWLPFVASLWRPMWNKMVLGFYHYYKTLCPNVIHIGQVRGRQFWNDAIVHKYFCKLNRDNQLKRELKSCEFNWVSRTWHSFRYLGNKNPSFLNVWQYIMMNMVLSLHISPPHFFLFSFKQCTGVHFIWVHHIWSSQLCKRLHAFSPWLSFTGLPYMDWLLFVNFCAEIIWMFQVDWSICKVNMK